jgi:hypothetical protein
MDVAIIVDGRKVGTATVKIDIPREARERHGVSAEGVLKAISSAQPQEWYCMGNVKLVTQA